MPTVRDYAYYKRVFAGRPMPYAFVDLDALGENLVAIAERAQGRRIRVASKSVRSTALLKKILQADPIYQGIMCFHADEAVHLAAEGFDDLLMGYPATHADHLAALCGLIKAGKQVVAMVDSPEHVGRVAAIAAREGCVLPVCLDVDMSMRLPGLHFGVRRSRITTVDQALEVYRAIEAAPHVRLDGVMGYEAQIAGVPDASPGGGLKDAVVRWLKGRSIGELAARRTAIVTALVAAGAQLRFVNGGGTGSIESTLEEPLVTEITVGSGFYSPALFDGYANFKHQPAAAYAIEITRLPEAGIYTCAGGGYVASGSTDANKQPAPYLPRGASLLPLEGAGEVQTPVSYRGGEALALGDPIFLRHAKAGELCERFERLYLVSEGEVVGTVPTYRGEGKCFL